jgi:haloalkane dehalogenase
MSRMDALRTPDDRFAGLPNFAYSPHYVEDLPGFEGLRAAYIDEGAPTASRVFFCLHGQPTWSYLYRRMIPPFLKTGARVIAPDMFGFGRSDKPTSVGDYGFDFHRNYLLRLIERLDLRHVTLVVQDWGGLLGLTLPVERSMEDRFARLIVMNTTIATGTPPSDGFLAWRAFAGARPDMAIGALVQRSAPHLSDEEAAAYDAPFPDASYKAGVRAFPTLVMTDPGMPGIDVSLAALKFWSTRWTGQSFMAWGAADPVFGLDIMEELRANINGCPPPLIIQQGGHFLQEWGDTVAQHALASFGDV